MTPLPRPPLSAYTARARRSESAIPMLVDDQTAGLVAKNPDERSVGQRILHVPGETVDEIVLTSMRFVRNHNDIPPGRKTGIRIPFLFGKEFLDRCKNNPFGGYLQQLLRMSPILRLDGSLSQDLLISGKTCERADYLGRSDQ